MPFVESSDRLYFSGKKESTENKYRKSRKSGQVSSCDTIIKFATIHTETVCST